MPSFVIKSFDNYLDSLYWKEVKDFRGIVVHHSATIDNPNSYCWDAIKRFHTAPPPEGNGWKDIGYHLGLEHADNFVPFLAGRSMYEFGAHAYHDFGTSVSDYNSGDFASIGICCVGNYDLEYPPADIYYRLVYMVQKLRKQFKMRRGVELFVKGHRETYAPHGPILKSCPGRLFDMDKLRRDAL